VEEDGLEGVLFVQQLRTEGQTGIVARAQNERARTLCQDNSYKL
jgi:hypothetical protein